MPLKLAATERINQIPPRSRFGINLGRRFGNDDKSCGQCLGNRIGDRRFSRAGTACEDYALHSFRDARRVVDGCKVSSRGKFCCPTIHYNMPRMLILLTNDDGIAAPGLLALYSELIQIAEVRGGCARDSAERDGAWHHAVHSVAHQSNE